MMFKDIYILENIQFSYHNPRSLKWLALFVVTWIVLYVSYFYSNNYFYNKNKLNNEPFYKNAEVFSFYVAIGGFSLISIYLIFRKTHLYLKLLGLGFSLAAVLLYYFKVWRNRHYVSFMWWLSLPYGIAILFNFFLHYCLFDEFSKGNANPIKYEIQRTWLKTTSVN